MIPLSKEVVFDHVTNQHLANQIYSLKINEGAPTNTESDSALCYVMLY